MREGGRQADVQGEARARGINSAKHTLSLSHYERGGIVDSAAAGGAVSVPVHVVMVTAGPIV